MGCEDEVLFETLLGVTLTEVRGCVVGSDEIAFIADDGRVWRMLHHQDCCEGVSVEDVTGDPADLIGTPLTMAEVVTNADDPAEWKPEYRPKSYTWTFYKLATVKGYVTIRWLGESSGYYSESVDFEATHA
jgi:hypothetical protein